MAREQIVIGGQYGLLTVLRQEGKREKSCLSYRCRCICGEEIVVSSRNLRSGRVKSCGVCGRVKFIPSGTRFGHLVVEEYVGTKKGKSVYLCQCDCGRKTEVTGVSLTRGATKSCGHCDLVSNAKEIEIGAKFGRLTVVARHGRVKGRVTWFCQCECGNQTIVTGTRLRSGTTRSCGCLAKENSKKHGLYGTKFYESLRSKIRRERERKLGNQWTLEMERLLRTMQPRCILCNASEDLTIDHVSPLARGYSLRPGNAVVLCRSCNSKKGRKSLSELSPSDACRINNAALQFLDMWEGQHN